MKVYDKYFDDFDIFDCAVSNSYVGVLARESNVPLSEVVSSKFVVLDITDEDYGDDFDAVELENFPDMNTCWVTLPERGFILVSSNGQVYKMGAERAGEEESWVKRFEEQIKGSWRVTKVRSINGKAYAVTGGRQVFRRDNVDTWVNIAAEISENERLRKETYEDRGGFNNIAGFSENDIYAVGTKGDCWHYDGKN